MNMYSTAKQIFNEMKKWRQELIKEMTPNEVVEFMNSGDYDELYKKHYEQQLKEFEQIAHIEIDIRERYKKVVEERGYENQDRLFDNHKPHNVSGNTQKDYMITISPKNDLLNPFEFKEKIDKYIERKMFDKTDDIIYSFEQRQNEDSKELGKGIHCHIIAKSSIPKSDIIKNSISTFNKICEPQGIDVRPINNLDIAVKYVMGIEKGGKTPEEKLKKIEHHKGDIKWRSIKGLNNHYIRPKNNPTGGGETSPSSPPPIETPIETPIILSFN